VWMAASAIRRSLEHLEGDHVERLFATRELAMSTSLLMILWAFIGLAFPLYNTFGTYSLLARVGDDYRNQIILSVIGIPGALLAGYMVELPVLGRRGTLSISAVLTGVFIFASATAGSSNASFGWICCYSFTSNFMYGVLYAISPELFPTKDRSTGNALVAASNRVFAIMSLVLALCTGPRTSVLINTSGVLFIASGLVALFLPYDAVEKVSL